MNNKFRKERYIVQQCRNNVWSFRVRYKDIDKTFNESDFLSASQAFKEAINYRNNILVKPNDYKVRTIFTVDEAYNSINEIYVLRSETKRKLDIFYKKYINNKDKNINDITRADILSDLNAMVETSSNDCIQRVLSIWKKIFGVSIAKGYIDKDLTISIKAPVSHKLRQSKRNEYIDEQLLIQLEKELNKRLKLDIDKKQAYPILFILYYTGMRPAELFALDKKDINLKSKTISINKEIGSDRDNQEVIRPCKTEMSHRIIPIPNKLMPVFKNLVKEDNGTILLPDPNGKHIDVTNLGARYHAIAKSIGIDFHFYQCRHTFITNLFMAGIDLKTIQELVGQTVDATTIGYVVTDNDRKKNAINIL